MPTTPTVPKSLNPGILAKINDPNPAIVVEDVANIDLPVVDRAFEILSRSPASSLNL